MVEDVGRASDIMEMGITTDATTMVIVKLPRWDGDLADRASGTRGDGRRVVVEKAQIWQNPANA